MDSGVVFSDVYKYVLRGASFKTGDKGVYVLLGPNGSGKTTALRLAAGVLKPDKGFVRVGGEDPYRDHDLRGRITYVANNPLADSFENVARYLTFYLRTTPRDVRGDLREALSYFGIEGLSKEAIYRLSAGQRKRVELSKILLRRAPYIFVDEPTANLDQDGRRRVVELLKKISDRSLVLVATHELDLVEVLRADVIRIRGGSVEGVYSYDEFTRISEGLVGGYIIGSRLLLRKATGDPRKALEKYGSSVEILRFEVDHRALFRSLGIENIPETSSISIIWVRREDVEKMRERMQGVTIMGGLNIQIPINIEILVKDRSLVPKLVEDIMSIGEIEDLRVSRVVGEKP
ncbi:MAG: ABC transporter ATP-binding protein [Sulfolobales archaeon]